MRGLLLLLVLYACAGCGCGVSGDMVGTWSCDTQLNTTIEFKPDKTYVYRSFLPVFRQDRNVTIVYEGDWRGGGDEVRMTPKTISATNLSPDNLVEVQKGVDKQVQWQIRWEDKQRMKWTVTDASLGSFSRLK